MILDDSDNLFATCSTILASKQEVKLVQLIVYFKSKFESLNMTQLSRLIYSLDSAHLVESPHSVTGIPEGGWKGSALKHISSPEQLPSLLAILSFNSSLFSRRELRLMEKVADLAEVLT